MGEELKLKALMKMAHYYFFIMSGFNNQRK